MKLGAGLLIAYLWIGGATACAQSFKNEFGFKSDNDSYLLNKQDRYYTNGLFIYFRHAIGQQKIGNTLEKLTYELSAGQKMYNPISGYRPNPQKHDRPFAAYLYAGASTSLFYKNESVLKTGIEIGILGPKAFGQETQEFLHRITGLYQVNGWQYQIKNDFAVNISGQYSKLLQRNANNSLDFSVETYANLGTTFSGAGLGILARTGNINPLFNSASTNAVIANSTKTSKLVNTEFFFYAKPQLNLVVYDATISGSLFNHLSEVTFNTKPLVFAQQLGINYSSARFTADFSVLFKSKEIKSTAKAHQYGSISMAYRFN